MTKKQFFISTLIYVGLTSTILGTIQFFLINQHKKVGSGYVGKINKVLNNQLKEEITIWGASTAEGNFIPKIIQEKTSGVLSFNKNATICEKKTWANTVGVSWDGVTNYNKC